MFFYLFYSAQNVKLIQIIRCVLIRHDPAGIEDEADEGID